MNDDVKAVIDEIANSLQVINLLSTRLQQISASRRNRQSTSKAQRLELFAR